MSRLLLILRPEPGASRTAAHAAALGLKAVKAPLFIVNPVPWSPPWPDDYDAVFLTSAAAADHAGPELQRFVHLPCWAVGPATAAAAEAAGFREVRAGGGNGASMAAAAVEAGVMRALHLHGREHVPLSAPRLRVDGQVVYSADAVALPPPAAAEIRDGVALIHSPRAGAVFASLVPDKGAFRLIAISASAARAAGEGWRDVAVARAPTDEAMLELAVKLCNNGPPPRAGAGVADGL